MPIRAERRALYPPDWKTISLAIRRRAGWRCEGSPGVYPDCRAVNGEPHPVTGSKVVLTVAHMDHDETSADPSNLRALCQRCHLTYDREHHARTRRLRSAQLDLENFRMTAPNRVGKDRAGVEHNGMPGSAA